MGSRTLITAECDLTCNTPDGQFTSEDEAKVNGWVKLTYESLHVDREWYYRWVCPKCVAMIQKAAGVVPLKESEVSDVD